MIRPGKVSELRAELATARREVAQLTNELQRLKMEGLQRNVFAAAIELADRVAAQSAEEGELADDTLQDHLQALVLREMILDLCESVERAMVSARAQLSSGLRPSELDRRKGDRRQSDGVATRAGSATVGIGGLPAISAADSGLQRIGSSDGDGNVTATETATETATRTNASKTNASKTNASKTNASKTNASKTNASKTASGSSKRKPRASAITSPTTGGSRSVKEG